MDWKVRSMKSPNLSTSAHAEKLFQMSGDGRARGDQDSIFESDLIFIHHSGDLPTTDVAACWIQVLQPYDGIICMPSCTE